MAFGPHEALFNLGAVWLGVSSGGKLQRGVDAVFKLDYIIVGRHTCKKAMNSRRVACRLQLSN